jgi:multidrug efflux pump subunit AcrA (membrane-fusion protein)
LGFWSIKNFKKDFERTKEMLANQAAPEKELIQAENNKAIVNIIMAEIESRMRAVGFNPLEMESLSSNTTLIMAGVSELQLSQIKNGEKVNIKLDAYPMDSFTCRVDSIGGILDSVTHTVKVRVTIQNKGRQLIPGLFAQVNFGNPISSAYIIPLSSVVTVQGNNYVFVKTSSNKFERRLVTVANSYSYYYKKL